MLRREVHAAQQVFGPRVRAKSIHLGVDFQTGQVESTILMRLLKPGECLIFFAKRNMKDLQEPQQKSENIPAAELARRRGLEW